MTTKYLKKVGKGGFRVPLKTKSKQSRTVMVLCAPTEKDMHLAFSKIPDFEDE